MKDWISDVAAVTIFAVWFIAFYILMAAW